MKKLLKKLIRVDTTTEKGELSAANIISEHLSRSGITSIVDSWDENRANIFAQIKSSGNKGGLLFACHLDVVGPGEEKWQLPPFSGTQSDGKIHGRGSADMKGGIVAAITAIEQIIKAGTKLQGDIIFLATAGEETDSCGAKRFVRKHSQQLPELAGVVIPEPTDFDVVTGHRGLLWLNVTTKGKAAHGSMPQAGINAISSMKTLLSELENYNPPQECSMSVNTIAGGKAINVVPDKCSIGIDIRTPADQNHQEIIDDFEKMFTKLKQAKEQFEAQVSVARDVEALETDQRSEFVKEFCSAVRISETKTVGFTTDGPYLAKLDVPVIIFGPGKGELCHKPNEYIEIADVEKAAEYYKKIILKFLA